LEKEICKAAGEVLQLVVCFLGDGHTEWRRGGQGMCVFGVACLAAARQLDGVDFFGQKSPYRIHVRVQLVQIDFQLADLLVMMDFLLGEFY
jgi:hypothetical protein